MKDTRVEPEPIRFLALGDSYTIGESVPAGESWPRLLAGRLRLEPTILATTGWTSGELLSALDEEEPAGSFGLVSLQIGVNDQYRGLAVADLVSNLLVLLDRARRLCEGGLRGVFVVSIPDWGVTSYAGGRDRAAITLDIDQFNAAIGDVAAEIGVPFVDITAASRAEPNLLAPDGLHPSGEQYRRWVDLIAPVAEAVLGRGTG